MAEPITPVIFNTGLEPQTLGAAPTYAEKFLRNAAESTWTLIGHEKSLQSRRFEEEHLVGGIISSLIAPVGYFGGAFKLGRMIPYGKGYEKLMNSTAHTVAKGMVRETAALAPFETARIGTTIFSGGDTEAVSYDVALNMGIGAGFGAAMGALESAGKRLNRIYNVAEDNVDAPLQVRAQSLQANIDNKLVPANKVDDAEAHLRDLELQIRQEQRRNKEAEFTDIVGRKKKHPTGYVEKPIIGKVGKGAKQTAHNLARLFNVSRNNAAVRTRNRMISIEEKGFSPEDYKTVRAKTGLSQADFFDSQFVRHRSFANLTAASTTKTTIMNNMTRAGPGEFVAQEAGPDGMYIVAKRITALGNRKIKNEAIAHVDDEWLILKTTNPGRFLDMKHTKFGELQQTAASYASKLDDVLDQRALQVDSMEHLMKGKDAIPVQEFYQPGKDFAQNLIKRMAAWAGYSDGGRAFQTFSQYMTKFFGVSSHTLANSPRGRWIAALAKMAHARAEGRSNVALYGKSALAEGENIAKSLVMGVPTEGGLMRMVDDLDEVKDLEQFFSILGRPGALAQAEAALKQDLVTPEFVALIKKLGEVDERNIFNIRVAQEVSGETVMRATLDHMMMSKTWRGDVRVGIYNGNELVGLSGGFKNSEALAEAKFIVEEGRKKGRKWSLKPDKDTVDTGDARTFLSNSSQDAGTVRYMSSNIDDLELVASIKDRITRARRPGFTKERKYGDPTVEEGLVGAMGYARPFTKKELKQIITNHVEQSQRYLADMSIRHVLKNDIRALGKEDGFAYEGVIKLLDNLVGKQGEFSKAINKHFDTVLGPWMGSNSASKIVRNMNQFAYHMTLGAFNMAYPALTLGTFTQTVLPELAFVATGSPGTLARYYQAFAIGGTKDVPPRVIHGLSIAKLQATGLKRLIKPDAQFTKTLNRAVNEGVLSPRLVEEVVGEHASIRSKFGTIVKNDGWMAGIMKMSSMAPESTERLSRAHAFAVMYDFAENVMKLDEEGIYRMAQEFTDRTMYQYNTANRSRIMTGAIGSGFGLFKTWQMNYIWNMMDYLGEGFTRNNWKPLLWAHGGSIALGGIPASGMAYWAADNAAEMFADKPLMDVMYEGFGDRDPNSVNYGDALWLGLPAFLPQLLSLPGVSLTGQASTPFSSPARDITQLMSFVYMDRAKSVGKAINQAWVSSQATGQNPLTNPRVIGNLARGLGPKAVYRAQQTLFNDGAIKSSTTQYPQITGLSPLERALYIAGFNPNKIELSYQAHANVWEDQERVRALTSELGRQLSDAQLNGDSDAARRIWMEIIVNKLDGDSVMRSATAFTSKAQSNMIERNLDQQRGYQVTKLFGLR